LINFAETVSRQHFHEKISTFDMIKTCIRWFEINPVPPYFCSRQVRNRIKQAIVEAEFVRGPEKLAAAF
jgi:hypothetical protein